MGHQCRSSCFVKEASAAGFRRNYNYRGEQDKSKRYYKAFIKSLVDQNAPYTLIYEFKRQEREMRYLRKKFKREADLKELKRKAKLGEQSLRRQQTASRPDVEEAPK